MKKLFLSVVVFLAGCGFSPLYREVATEGSVPVKVNPIPEQYGFSMRQIIQNKLGNSDDTHYTLNVSSPTFSSWDQTIDNRNFATLMGTSGTVKYTLIDNKTKRTILNSSSSLNTSYSVVQDPYATTVAERKAKQELAEQLAEQVSLHVLGTLAGVRD